MVAAPLGGPSGFRIQCPTKAATPAKGTPNPGTAAPLLCLLSVPALEAARRAAGHEGGLGEGVAAALWTQEWQPQSPPASLSPSLPLCPPLSPSSLLALWPPLCLCLSLPLSSLHVSLSLSPLSASLCLSLPPVTHC